MSTPPTYRTDMDLDVQARAVVSEGFCPYCGEKLRPTTTPDPDVQVEGFCSRHGLWVITRDGVWHNVTVHGLAAGLDWR